MLKSFRCLVLSIAVVFAAACSGCGGGGGGAAGAGTVSPGPATPLTVAEQVSVVDAQPGAGGGAPIRSLKAGLAAVRTATYGADADYTKDATNVYVHERSIQAFSSVNEILCMIAQTKYDLMLNQGPYTAQVDQKLCNSASGGGNGDQTSGSNAPSYAMWTVDSVRADNASLQTVTVWVHEPAQDMEPAKQIRAKMVITEGASASNPYGIFRIDFLGYPVVGDVPMTDNIMFRGFLLTERDPGSGKILLKFSDAGGLGSHTYSEQATLDRSSDGSSGGGTIRQSEGGSPPVTFNLAYSDSEFLRSGADNVCLSRTQFDESVWRYGLYEFDNGARVNRNSGFPVKVTQGGKDYNGWIGYYGIWFPNEVVLSNGDTVIKQSYGPGGGTEDPYQVFLGGGKLFKHVRKSLTLGDIRNVALQYQAFDPMGPSTPYRVVWDNNLFNKVAVADGNWNWSSTSGVLALDNMDWPNVNFYSQALSGEVQLNPTPGECTQDGTTMKWSCAFSDTTPVIIYTQSLIYPGDNVPASLACFDQCPDAAAIDTGDPMHPFSGMIPAPPATAAADNAYSYTFVGDSGNYVLKEGSTDVVRTATGTGTQYQYGVQAGPLFDPTAPNLALLACDWDNSATCPWQARGRLPEYYTWETGPNTWNRLAALTSGGSVLQFDPPLQVEYVHDWGGGSTSRFYLEYSGFGNLNGVPGTCVDMDTGAKVDCGPDTRWVPEFNIPGGSTATAGNTTYIIKQLDKEQRMQENPAGCGSLILTSYPLLDLSTWSDPNLGTEPAVTGPPKVIGGIVQE